MDNLFQGILWSLGGIVTGLIITIILAKKREGCHLKILKMI